LSGLNRAVERRKLQSMKKGREHHVQTQREICFLIFIPIACCYLTNLKVTGEETCSKEARLSPLFAQICL